MPVIPSCAVVTVALGATSVPGSDLIDSVDGSA